MKKRLVAILLLVSLIITFIPTSALADSSYGSFEGNGTGGGNGGASGGGTWVENQSGYRFYLVDKRGEQVSNCVDVVWSTNLPKGKYIMAATKVDNGTTPSHKTITVVSRTAFDGIPAPTVNELGNGKALKAWLTDDIETDTVAKVVPLVKGYDIKSTLTSRKKNSEARLPKATAPER